ncbi:FliI/YscN family ATPase [Erythrobacter sp. HL-111]|uniref:FliI/YscN family ATPase n=1 Tax=Erythrobacter sp. HL-111 TaxID=1798193 RepID=UPI0006DAADB7|nr:FliI/YscN family ATPase [Erythrobacter sp. HL-111]KPP92581.1 MAG: flagellar protein export ATPase FliI [Erythrobacteraceae bacterium HL-111]SDS92984.1 flagellum-specific ATP synthase [Erythrobacter sp. HL-111]
MIAELQIELARLARAAPSTGPVLTGRVAACDGGLVEVSGLPLPIGSLGAIDTGGAGECLAEVIGFRGGRSLMMLLGDPVLLRPRAAVRACGSPGEVRVGEALLGRAVDGLGRPIDGGPAPACEALWPLAGRREGALERAPVREAFDCGVRAINALATMGVGQRLGVIAGSGVGKSVLIDQMTARAVADVTVVALIGERAREVSDFVARHMAGAGRGRLVVVAVPADHAPNLRLRASQYACAIAEWFRARGKRVLLVLDSLTRVAHAARELALVLGEPGAARGYPPSALAAVTRLVERAGNSARTGGAVTGLYTVLADGDDVADPVVDTARAILDGHIVLSRDLAQRGHYPAIDVPASLSRVMDDIVPAPAGSAARRLRSLIAAREENRDLVLMGAYRAGSDPVLDRALAAAGAIDAFLQQGRGEAAGLADSLAALEALVAGIEGAA